MLTRIEFTNFRGFRKLLLDGLQRVNLIVGKNNSGKTSLLEGCAALLNCSEAPKEFSKLRQLEQGIQGQFQQNSFSDWVVHDAAPDKTAKLSGIWSGSRLNIFLAPTPHKRDVVIPNSDRPSATPGGRRPPKTQQVKVIKICVVSALHIRPEDLVQSLGDAVTRSGGEELLESALRSVDSRIRKVRIVPSQKKTLVVIDIGLSKLVPISQVGQGTFRLVEMFSEIIGADAQVAFVDELENGIHHTCLTDVWKGLAEAAKLFDVQIFATTHSHECIEAAHAAFLSRPKYDFGIIQLFREAGEIQGRVLHQQHIAAAIAGDIDLRA